MVKWRKQDFDDLSKAAEEVKGARGTSRHKAAVGKAKAVVDKSKQHNKEDRAADRKAANAERRQAGRRKP